MGMSAASTRAGVKADINVTPLIDVVLVLLIIFLVVTPKLVRGRDVQLPEAVGTRRTSLLENVISLTRDGTLYLGAEPVAAKDLRSRFGRGTPVLLKADASLTFAEVQRVLTSLRREGIDRVALAVDVQAQ